MAGRSYAQVSGVLRRLVDHGLVDVEQHGRTYSYRLNRDHVLAPAVEALASAGDDVEARLRAAVGEWKPRPRAVILFGSFARRDGDPGSDIDVCLVRPDDVPEDGPAWAAQRYNLARQLERWTGNTAQMVELSVGELEKAVRRNDPLVSSLRREGRALIGPNVRSLLAVAPAKARR
jgi:predicted nucleotidyltransferase